MIQNVLHRKLEPLIDAERTLRRRKVVASILTLGALALVALLALARLADWWSWIAVLVTFAVVSIAMLIGVWWADSRSVDVKTLVKRIEDAHPDLQAALMTAVEQEPGKDGQLGYLQERVVYDAVDHALQHEWVKRVSSGRLIGAAWLQMATVFAFGAALWALLGEARPIGYLPEAVAGEVAPPELPKPELADYEIQVLPGDTEVERGARLIVEAQFGERIPPNAMLVMREPGEEGAERGRVPMKAGLDEAVFSGLIAAVDSDTVYRIEFDGDNRSDEFSIATYIHPELEQADAEITPPAYAKQEAKKIENVRKVSLLEGSDLAWSMKINKPVAAAELFGEDESVIPLTPSPDDATVLVASHRPDESQKYRLHLVDEKDRANKQPPWFTVTVKRNLPPKLDFTFPKRDVEVSSLEELPVEAKIWDDLGVLKAGATFTHGDQTREVALLDGELPGGTEQVVRTLFALEELDTQPRDLVSYHLWAEDLGPDGQPRRTSSDMFFAEVRYFEDIFRESESMSGKGQPQEGEGNSAKLLKLQKEVMNATWKLIRRADMDRGFEDIGSDIGVVKESQQHAIGQTKEAWEKAEDPELKVFFGTAAEQMEEAVKTLEKAIESKDTKPLRPAHEFERKAYESLIRARSREHDVTQSQSQSSGQGQPQEQQLMQLEMKQKEMKYEEESEAQDPVEKALQDANLDVLNRLKELARRQEAIAEKIKELQNALEEAKTEEEKQELERQLKRLQEEQEQLLRDLDDLTEKMDTEQNRPNMAEEREKIEETREDVREAAEKLEEGKLADAANAATRAQREIEEVQEEFRKKTSRRFDQEMRDLRQRARDLAENQEEIGKKFEENPSATEKENPFDERSSPLANAELARELESQKKALGEMLEEMRELSENAEESEPILSTAIYDAFRKARTGGIEESLDEARDLTRYNRREMAQESERVAARGLEELKEGVEEAAEKVLGSEADALRLARSELESLIEQAREESERLGGGEKPGGEESESKDGEPTDLAMNDAGKDPTKEGQVGDPTGSGEEEGQKPGAKPGENQGEGKGETDSEGQEKGQGKGKGQPGEKPGEGDGQGQLAENGKGKGKGTQPGEGEGEGQEARPGESSGKGKGQGKGEGEGQGEGQEPGKMAQGGQQPGQGEGESDSPGQGKGKGKGKGEGQGEGKSEGRPGELAEAGQPSGASGTGSSSAGGNNQSGMGGPNFGGGQDQGPRGPMTGENAQGGKPLFFQGNEETEPGGPIAGSDYEQFADRLRNVESMVEQDDLRNELAKVMDDARAMRIEFRRNNSPPQASTINQRITMPLVEIRDRVAEELAKLDKENPLAPIDRDPVPREYRELVRRYYEELGSGR